MNRSVTQPVRGFTLIELMVTIFVLAILLAVAIPSFQHAINDTHLGGASNALMVDLKYARSEAASRGGNVAVNASSSGNWQDGWAVVAQAATAGGSNAFLRRHDALDSNDKLALQVPGKTGVKQVMFNAQGVLAAPDKGACFTFKAANGNHNQSQHIVLRASGAISRFKGDNTASTPCK